MSAQPIHWIASSGKITPVVILEPGIGEHTPKYIPPDPVVVRSVEDYYEFVASEACLFTDRAQAIIEAKKLRIDKIKEIESALSRIERKEMNGINLLPTKNGGDSTAPLVIEVAEESSVTQAEDVVVPKSIDEPTKPQTLLQRIIHVVGKDTLIFDDICVGLEQREWMPKRRSSVSNVLSANKHLFLCPDRGTYSLRATPKATPTEEDISVEEGPEEVTEETQDLEPNCEGESDTVEESDPEEGGPSEEPTGLDTWLSKPMKKLSTSHYHYRDNDVVMSEKFGSGNWVAEIFVTGLELWYYGVSEDRAQARIDAEQMLRTKVQNIGQTIKQLGI